MWNQVYENWLKDPDLDQQLKQELLAIKNKPREIQDRFCSGLEFGTGGLRGLMGAGTNRINRYTVAKASQGLAQYLLKDKASANQGIVIAYDSRQNSYLFALEAAKVFTGNGIKTYLFDELRPTPELSFAVKVLHAAAGIVITASHNPKQYNGYKVYGEDGGQLTPRTADLLSRQINSTGFIKRMRLCEAEKSGLLVKIGNEIDEAYISALKTLLINQQLPKQLKIVYTPLNGAGNKPVRRILEETGFINVSVVKKQELPDPQFMSLKLPPNPEEKGVFKAALKLARKENADLILATDPDSDRLGIMVKNLRGRYVLLSGNQVGILLMDYILSFKQARYQLPPNALVLKTIISSQMAKAVAAYYNAELMDVLPGFKYIGEKIRQTEEKKSFVFGFEESCGYLAGTFVRDKDAVMAAMLFSEMAAFYHWYGLSVYQVLQELYEKFGNYTGCLVSFKAQSKEKIQLLQEYLGNPEHQVFKNLGITALRDYRRRQRSDLLTGLSEPILLPASNILFYELKDGSWFCIRPSGTEPKLKLYIETCGRTQKAAEKKLKNLKKTVSGVIKKFL